MFRNERYFDKNDNKKNFYGQADDVLPGDESEDREMLTTHVLEEESPGGQNQKRRSG